MTLQTKILSTDILKLIIFLTHLIQCNKIFLLATKVKKSAFFFLFFFFFSFVFIVTSNTVSVPF